MSVTNASLLVISGLEANGFAGLARDLQVAHALGAQAAVLATCLTAQNAQGIFANYPVPCKVIAQQLGSLIEPPKVIKIGVLPNKATAGVIAQWIESFKSQRPKVVLDPVWLNSGDSSAFSPDAIFETIAAILPFVTLLTPNLSELKALVRGCMQDASPEDLIEQFYQKYADFNGSLLLTGLDDEVNNNKIKDLLTTKNLRSKTHCFIHEKQKSLFRGTGCLLSTAIACALLEQYSLESAVALAGAYLAREFSSREDLAATDNPRLNKNWPENSHYYPFVCCVEKRYSTTGFAPMTDSAGLYPIVENSQWIELLAKCGIKIIQLRIKNKSMAELEREMIQAIAISKVYKIQLFINDYWQLAIDLGAYGIHLGQEDLHSADLAQIKRAGLRLGISTHGDYEFLLAKQLKPSYLAVGAIFPTDTKDMSGKIQGTQRLKRYCAMADKTPVVAIGGINANNIQTVIEAGPAVIAVVSAITRSPSPKQSVKTLRQYLP